MIWKYAVTIVSSFSDSLSMRKGEYDSLYDGAPDVDINSFRAAQNEIIFGSLDWNCKYKEARITVDSSEEWQNESTTVSLWVSK